VSDYSLTVNAFDSMGNESSGCNVPKCVTVLDTNGVFDAPIGKGNADNINRNSIPVKFTTYYNGSAYFGIPNPVIEVHSRDAAGNDLLLTTGTFGGSAGHWQYNLMDVDGLLETAGAAVNANGDYEVTITALPAAGTGCYAVFDPVPTNTLYLSPKTNGKKK